MKLLYQRPRLPNPSWLISTSYRRMPHICPIPDSLIPSLTAGRQSQSRRAACWIATSTGTVERGTPALRRIHCNIDSEFGRLLDHLEESGRLDDSILMVTSDHGETFERGEDGHSTRTLRTVDPHTVIDIRSRTKSAL